MKRTLTVVRLQVRDVVDVTTWGDREPKVALGEWAEVEAIDGGFTVTRTMPVHECPRLGEQFTVDLEEKDANA